MNHHPISIHPNRWTPSLPWDFDTRADGARDEVEELVLVEETWSNCLVVIFSQVSRNCWNAEDALINFEQPYSPIGRELGALIATYNLAPLSVMWELDVRGTYAPESSGIQAYLNSL